MDDSLQELEFLDLGGLTDDERRSLRSYLVDADTSPACDGPQSVVPETIEVGTVTGGYEEDGIGQRYENVGHHEHVAGIPVSSMAPTGYPSPMHHHPMYMTALPHQFHHSHQPAVMTTHYPMTTMFHSPGNYYVNSMAAAQHHPLPAYPHHHVPMPNSQHPFPHYNQQPKRKPNAGGSVGRSKYSPRKEVPNGHIVGGDIGSGGFAYHGQHSSNGAYYPSNPAMVQAATGVPIVMHPQPVTAAYLPPHPAVQVSAASNAPMFQDSPLVSSQSHSAPVVVTAAPPAVVVPPPLPLEVVQLPPALSPVVSPPLPPKVVADQSPAPLVEKVATAVVEEAVVVVSPPVVDKAPELLASAAPVVRSTESVVTPTTSPEVASRAETTQQPASPEEPLADSSGTKLWTSLFKKNVPAAPGIADKPTARVEPFSTTPGNGGVASEGNDATVADESFSVGATAAIPIRPAVVDVKTRRLAEHLSSYELVTTPVALLPRGLINKGNWCYINATLQALIACPPFVHLVKSLTPFANSRALSEKSTTPIVDSVVDFIDQFVTVPVRTGKERSSAKKEEPQFGSSFEPSSIYKMLSKIRSETFKVEGRQEDAEEFLSCLLNGLHDEMIEVMKTIKGSTNDRNGRPGQQPSPTAASVAEVKPGTPDDEDWQVIGPKNRGCVTRSTNYSKTPVSNLFLGVMRSALHAHSNHSSEFEPYFSLQLDIQSDKVNSVRDALAALVAKEPLSGYVCSKTGQEVEASRQTTFEELPPILILHLKCFVYDKSGGCQKLLKRVEFSSDLELSKDFLSPMQKSKLKERQRQYKLFAVVYHDGKEATKGHYVTEVHHTGTGSWLRFDDSIIRVVDTQLFKYSLPRMPYLLLYKKVNI